MQSTHLMCYGMWLRCSDRAANNRPAGLQIWSLEEYSIHLAGYLSSSLQIGIRVFRSGAMAEHTPSSLLSGPSNGGPETLLKYVLTTCSQRRRGS